MAGSALHQSRGRGNSGLDGPTNSLTVDGNYEGKVAQTSLYTQAALHPVVTGAIVVGLGLAVAVVLQAGPHRPPRFVGNQGGRTEKALHIRLKARRGKEREVANLLDGIRRDVAAGPGTRPWFAVRLSRRVFGIFERFPNEAGRKAHLAGRGVARLMTRSNAVLAKPAAISKLDLIGVKPS